MKGRVAGGRALQHVDPLVRVVQGGRLGCAGGQPIAHDGELIHVDEQTTLRTLLTPGHAPDHACWVLEEEGRERCVRAVHAHAALEEELNEAKTQFESAAAQPKPASL